MPHIVPEQLPPIDFSCGAIDYRRRQATVRREAIARAAGLKGSIRPIILDATAGFGQDSFILAALGCEVWLFERCPTLHAHLQEALSRALASDTLAPIVRRMHLSLTDAADGLLHPPVMPDVVCLDPMFPERKHAAAVRKSMRLLQTLTGPAEDVTFLLEKALCCAKKRVVVKRPRISPFPDGLAPDFSLRGNSSRFDVYLIRKINEYHPAHADQLLSSS